MFIIIVIVIVIVVIIIIIMIILIIFIFIITTSFDFLAGDGLQNYPLTNGVKLATTVSSHV
jgi:hypothetical protein